MNAPADSTLQYAGHSSPRSKPTAPTPNYVSAGKPLRHVSPRKFQQIQQQQRTAVLRAMPLSPLSARSLVDAKLPRGHNDKDTTSVDIYEPRESVPWNPAWLPEAAADQTNTRAVEALLVALGAMGTSPATKVGTQTLEAWLQSYEQDFLVYESLERFIQVKLPEALAFCDKIEQQTQHQPRMTAAPETAFPSSRFHVRLRIAVYAHLVERTVFAMAQSASLSHAKKSLFRARQEIFRAMFADYDKQPSDGGSLDSDEDDDDEDDEPRRAAGTSRHRRQTNGSRPDNEEDEESSRPAKDRSNESGSSHDSSDESDTQKKKRRDRKQKSRYSSALYGPTAAPRTLGFFLTKVPYALKLREDTQRRALRFKRNQVVLRRIVQSLYRSLGTVFHAWKLHVRHRKEERLNSKGAQLTAMVVQQRGLVRSVFVEWSKATLQSKIREMKVNELEMKQQHEQVLADLHKEIFLLRETNHSLQLEVLENHRHVSRKFKPPSVQTPTNTTT